MSDGGIGLCPFCRTPGPTSDEESIGRFKKRVELDDADAMNSLGCWYYHGAHGLPQDYTKAFKLWQRPAELGHASALYNIGHAYDQGEGVEVDKKKAVQYYEQGAMKGDVRARYNLGVHEQKDIVRAIKHWLIATRCGLNRSLKKIQQLYSNGNATKDDYTAALQAYQVYLGEIKSSQRDEAASYDNEQILLKLV